MVGTQLCFRPLRVTNKSDSNQMLCFLDLHSSTMLKHLKVTHLVSKDNIQFYKWVKRVNCELFVIKKIKKLGGYSIKYFGFLFFSWIKCSNSFDWLLNFYFILFVPTDPVTCWHKLRLELPNLRKHFCTLKHIYSQLSSSP